MHDSILLFFHFLSLFPLPLSSTPLIHGLQQEQRRLQRFCRVITRTQDVDRIAAAPAATDGARRATPRPRWQASPWTPANATGHGPETHGSTAGPSGRGGWHHEEQR